MRKLKQKLCKRITLQNQIQTQTNEHAQQQKRTNLLFNAFVSFAKLIVDTQRVRRRQFSLIWILDCTHSVKFEFKMQKTTTRINKTEGVGNLLRATNWIKSMFCKSGDQKKSSHLKVGSFNRSSLHRKKLFFSFWSWHFSSFACNFHFPIVSRMKPKKT